MFNRINLEENGDGTCNILINYSSISDTEFGLEFLSSEHLKSNAKNIIEFVKKTIQKVKVNAIKIIIDGVVITTMSLSSFMNIYGAIPSKYSMAYLQSGTSTDQIAYINRTNGALGTVSPSYFNINKDGSLSLSTISPELINHAHSNGMKVIPFLSNHWDKNAGIIALSNAETLSTEIANYISQYNLDGVNVDIENVTELQRDQYTDFVAKLRLKIPISKEVSVAVAANPSGWSVGWHGSYDYTNLAKISDYLMIMTYDEHWHGSDLGPVSSISFVENSIKYALTKTTGDKIVIGLPFYGRIWDESNSFDGDGITLDRVPQIISTYKGIVTYDDIQKAPKAVFTVNASDPVTTLNNKTLSPGKYTIWYENEASIQTKMSLIQKYNLKGVGAWALGQEPSTIWQNYSKWLGNAATSTPVVPLVVSLKTGIVNTTKLNVRSSPSTKAKILTTVKKNSSVNIEASKNGWYTIKLAGGQTGYVSSNYINEKVITTPKVTTANKAVPSKTGIITTALKVRSSASTRSKIIKTIKRNSSVTILSTKNGWHTIKLPNGQTGYITTSYVKIK